MKISYSICSAWWRGDKDKAIRMLNGEDVEAPLKQERAMGFGKGAHFAWELESKATGKLPAIFKLPQFKVIGTEVKLYKKLGDSDWLSGVIDVVAKAHIGDDHIVMLGDYKTGHSSDIWQARTYHYLIHDSEWWNKNIPDYQPTQFWFLYLDKITGETSTEIVKLTYPETQEEWKLPEATTYTAGANYILTILQEMKAELGIDY